jgi:hypothetical protein
LLKGGIWFSTSKFGLIRVVLAYRLHHLFFGIGGMALAALGATQKQRFVDHEWVQLKIFYKKSVDEAEIG